MRPEKLMIGDWVSLFQGNPDGSSCNVRVSYIGEYGEVGIDGCEEYTSANCNLLFPIPLTPEILEKNGFVKQAYDGWLISENNGRRLIEYRTDYFDGLLRIVYAEEPFSKISIKLKYVHQLQHALKVCGIDKEIEI